MSRTRSQNEFDEHVYGNRYRLMTIDPAPTPEGCTGTDWFVYRIAQGKHVITGYRHGSRTAVDTEVEILIDGLNGRRHLSNGNRAGALLN